jgi:hypothetical protein
MRQFFYGRIIIGIPKCREKIIPLSLFLFQEVLAAGDEFLRCSHIVYRISQISLPGCKADRAEKLFYPHPVMFLLFSPETKWQIFILAYIWLDKFSPLWYPIFFAL